MQSFRILIMEEIMAEASKRRAMHMPEEKSAFSKVFEFAMGPGVALAVLIVLSAYLVVNDQADERAVYAAQEQLPAR